MSILVTGSTGFLGKQLVNQLLEKEVHLVLLVRAGSIDKISDEWKNNRLITIVAGDIIQSSVLNDEADLKKLEKIQDVVHLAASYSFKDTLSTAYIHNVVGTQNILDLAFRLPKLKRFHAASTIAIAGDFQGRMQETMFNVGQKFTNPYASTKYRAEGLLGAATRPDVKRIVYRLGVIVGDSKTGEISKFDGPYYFFESLKNQPHFWKTLTQFGRCPLPYHAQAEIPLIPVDIAAHHLAEMISSPSQVPGKLRTYHLSGAHVRVESLLTRGFEEFSYKCKPIPVPKWAVPQKLLNLLGIPGPLLDYMYQRVHFDDKHVQTDFPHLKTPSFENFSDALFAFLKRPAP